MVTTYLGVPFANSGDKTTIPDASQPNGNVSFEDGYTPDYSKDQATDADAKDIPRQGENYLKFIMTEALKELQESGFKVYAGDVNYPVGALAPGSDGQLYKCLIKNGPGAAFLPVVDPVGDGTGTWRVAFGLTPGAPVATTGAAFFDFPIPTDAKSVKMPLADVSIDGNDDLLIQLKGSGALEVTGYSGSCSKIDGNPDEQDFSTGFRIPVASFDAKVSGSIELTLLNPSTNKWACDISLGNPSQNNTFSGGGFKTITGKLTEIRLTTFTGTPDFDDGEANTLSG